MTTEAVVSAYGRGVNDITTLALRDVNELLAFVSDANPTIVRDSLVQLLPQVIEPYILASGELAATWYEDLRASAVAGTFYATSSGELNQARVRALVGYAVKPLFGQSSSTVLTLMGGGVQRMVSGAGRDTISANIGRDRVRVGFARIPRTGCCSFCAMLASRGAVYASEASAGGVVGRGVDASVTAGRVGGQGRGVRARGNRAIGSNDYHDFCNCVATPVFQGGDNAFVNSTADKYKSLYDEAFELNATGAISEKETLSSWRQVHGTT